MCVSAAQPLGRFMAVGALNALAVDFGIQAIAGVFPYWDMLYRNYHGLGFRPLETMVWAEEWDDDKEAPELHWRLATVPACELPHSYPCNRSSVAPCAEAGGVPPRLRRWFGDPRAQRLTTTMTRTT